MLSLRLPFEGTCPYCRGQLQEEVIEKGNRFPEVSLFCCQCRTKPITSWKDLKIKLKIIVVPPLDFLLIRFGNLKTDLRGVEPENRPWAYLVGQIVPVDPLALPINYYCLAIYTLLTPWGLVERNNEYYWQLEKKEEKPIIKPDETLIWKAAVDVGYGYFVLVFKEEEKLIDNLRENYKKRLPLADTKGVVLTDLLWPQIIFRPAKTVRV